MAQLQLVFLASFPLAPRPDRPVGARRAVSRPGGRGRAGARAHPAQRPGRYRPITDAIAHVLENASETLDVVNPYVTDRGMIGRIERAARRGVRVRLFVPANANNWACAGAQQFHHAKLLEAGVRILEYPTMLHARSSSATATSSWRGRNLEAWSLKRFFEIDIQLRSTAVAAQFEERFSKPAEAVSTPGRPLTGTKQRARAAALAAISPLL